MSRHDTAATPTSAGSSPPAPDGRQPRPLASRSLDSDTATNGSSPGFRSGPQSPRPLPRAPAYPPIAESPLNWEGAAEDSTERLSSYDFWNPYAAQPLRRARAASGLTAAVQRREGSPRQAAQAARGARRAASGGQAPSATSGGQSSIGSASSLPLCSEPGSSRGSNDVDGGLNGPSTSSPSSAGASSDAPPGPSGSGSFSQPPGPSPPQSGRERKSWPGRLFGFLAGFRNALAAGLHSLRRLGAAASRAAFRARDGLTRCATLAGLGCQALWRLLAVQVGRIRLRPPKALRLRHVLGGLALIALSALSVSLFRAVRNAPQSSTNSDGSGLPVVLLLLWCLALAAGAAQKGGPRRDLLTTGTSYSRVAFTLHSGNGARFSPGIEAAGTNLSTLLDGNHWIELPEGASFDLTFSLVHDYAESNSSSIELGSDCKVVATLAPDSSALAYGEFFDASNLPEGDLYYDLNTDFTESSSSSNQWTIRAKDNGIADGDRMFPLTFYLSCDAGQGAQVGENDTLHQYYFDLFSGFPALQIMVIVTDDDDLGVLGTGGVELEPGSSCVLGVSLSTEPPTAPHVPLEADWYTGGAVLDDTYSAILLNNPSLTGDQISRYFAQGRLALSGEETRDLGPRDDPSDSFPRLRFTQDNWPSSQAILLRAPETDSGTGRAVDIELYSRLDPGPIWEDEVTRRYGAAVSEMDPWGVAVGQEYPDDEFPGYNVELLSSAYMVNATGIINAFPLVTVLGPLVLNDTSQYMGEKYAFSMTEGSIINVTLGVRLADVGANIGANLSVSAQGSASAGRLRLVDYSSGEAVLVSDLLISAADINTTFGIAAIDNTDTSDPASFLLSISYYDSGLDPYIPFAGIMGAGATQVLISIIDEDEAAFMESPSATPYLHESAGETSLGFRPVSKPSADVTVTPILYITATTYGPDGAAVYPPLKIAGEHVPGHTGGEWFDLRSLATPGSSGVLNITLRDITFSPDNFSDPAYIRVDPYEDGLLAYYTFWLDFGDVASEDLAYRNLSQVASTYKYTFYYYLLNDEPRALLMDGTSTHTYCLASFNPLPPKSPPAPTSISFSLTFAVTPSADVAVRLYARGIYRPGSPRVTYTLNDTYGSCSTGSFTFEDFAPFDGCRLAYFNESSDPYDYEKMGPFGLDCGPLLPPYNFDDRFNTYADGQVVYLGTVTIGAGNGTATITLEVPWDESAVPRQAGPYGDTLTYIQAATNSGTKMIPIPFGIQLEAIVHDTIAPEYPLGTQLPVLGTVLLREAAQAGVRVEQAAFGSSDFSLLSGDILGSYLPPTTFVMESTGLQLRLSLNTEPFYPVLITASIGWLPPGAESNQMPLDSNRLHLANGAWSTSFTLASLSDSETLLLVAPDNMIAEGDMIVSVMLRMTTYDPFYAAQGYQRRFMESPPTTPDFSLSQAYIVQAINMFQFPLAVHILVIDDDVAGLAAVKGGFSDATAPTVAFQSAMQVKEGDSCLLRLALSSEPSDTLKIGVNATFADAFHFPYDAAGLDNPFDNLTIYANSSLWEAYSGVSADGWVAWGPRPVFYPGAWEAQQVLELTWPANKLMSPAGFNGVVLGLTLEEPFNSTANVTYSTLDGYYYGDAPESHVDYEAFVTAAVVDDERIGVIAVAPSPGRWAVEGQAAAFNLSLASEPQSDVQIRVTGLCTFGYNSTYGQPLYHRVTNLTVTTPVLLFTPNDWDAAQNVTFTTGSDIYYSNYLCEFYFSAVSEDLQYNEMASQRFSFVLWDDREQALLFSGQVEAPMNATIAEDASWAYLYETPALEAFYASNRSFIQSFSLLSSPLPGSQVSVIVIPYNTSSDALSRRRLAAILGGATTHEPSASILEFGFPDPSFGKLRLQAGVNMTSGLMLQFNESTWNVPYPIVIRSPADNVLGATSSEVSSQGPAAFTEYLFGAHLLYNYWDSSLNDYSLPQPSFSLKVLEGDRAGLRLRAYGASRVDLGGGSLALEFNTSILLGESVTFVNPDDLQHGFPILVSGSEFGGLFSVSTMTDLGEMGVDSAVPLFVSLEVTAWPACTAGTFEACPPLPYFGTVSSQTPSISGAAASNSGSTVHSVDVELTGSGLREVFVKLYYPLGTSMSSLPMLRLTATIKAAQAAAMPSAYLNGYGLPSGSYTDLLIETVDSPALQALVGSTTNGIIQIQEGSGCLAEVALATSDTATDIAITVYAEPLAVPGEEGQFPQNDWSPWGIARLYYTTAPEVDPAGTAQGPTSFLVPLYAQDDRVAEGNAGYMVTIQAESLSEAPYRLPLLSIPSLVAVGIVEDDGPGIDARPAVEGQTSFNETDTFVFFARLTSSPARWVVLSPVIDFVVFEYNGEQVQAIDSTDYILEPTSHNFTTSDWDSHVQFNFTILRTDKLPVDRQMLIKFRTFAEEPVYNGTTWPTYLNLTLINIDVPRPCFNSLCRLGFSTNVTEGSSVPLELFLKIPPAAQETVTLTLDFGSSAFSTELSFTDPTSSAATFSTALTFTESDYDKPQAFTVYSIDNEYYDRDAAVPCNIVLTSASLDGYRTYPLTQTFAFTVNLLENDAFSIVFSPTSVIVSEADGVAQTVAVSLGSKPRSLVTLTLITDGLTTGGTGTDLMTISALDTRVITSTKTIVFDPAAGDSFWSTPQTVQFSPDARDSIQRLPSGSVIQYGWNITQTAAFNPMNGLSNRDAGLESNVFLVDYEEADTASLVRSPSPVAILQLYEIPGGLYGFEVNVSLATIPLGPVKLTPALTADPIPFGRSNVATIPTLGFSPPYVVFASANYSTVTTFMMTIEPDYRIQDFSTAALEFTVQSLDDPFYRNLDLAAGGWNANLTDLSVAKLCQENSKTECIINPVLGFLIGDNYDISLRPAYEPKQTVTASFASLDTAYFTLTPKADLVWTQSNWTSTVNVTVASKNFTALETPVRVTVNATASSTDTAWTHGNVLELKFTVSSYSTETDGLFAPGSPLLLSLGSGLSLNISGSALGTSASIAMAYLVQDDLDNLDGLAAFVKAYKYFFSLTPHGTAFAEDVEFCAPIPIKNGAPDTENMRIFKAPSPTSSAWTVVQISKPLRTLSTTLQCAPCKVSSFSVVAFTAASSSIVATPNQGGTPSSYTENAAGVPIWPALALSALPGTLAVRAEVSFSSCIGTTDQITLDPAYNTTGGWSLNTTGTCTGANPVAMVLTPTSNPAGLSMASLQTALRSVWFTQDNEDDPSAATRSFTLTILEDDYVGYYSTSAASFVAQAVVVPVNDPPRFRKCAAGSIGASVVLYTEKQPAVSLLPSGCEIYDPEASGIQSMVVTVSPVDSAGHDNFTFPTITTTYPALTSSYASATNTWTVTTKNGFSAGSTEYTAALGLATFKNPGLKIVTTNRTVTVVLTDAGSSTQTSVYYLNITLVNDAPAPLAGNAYTLTEDVPLTASYASWGADPEDDRLEIIVQCSPSKGTITFDYPNQQFTYTPNANEYGSDVLVYTVSDGILEDTIDLQLVTFTITDVPDNPIFQADSCNFGYTPAVRSTVATSQDFSMAGCFTDPDGPVGQLASLVIDATDSVFLGAYTFTIPSGSFTPTAANPTVTLLYSDATYSFTFSYAASRVNLKNGGSIYSSDTLQLTATDKTGRVTTGSLTMTITSSSKAPSGVGNNVTVPQGSKDIPILLECTPASSSDTTTCATTNTDTVYTLVTSPPSTLLGSLRFVSGSNNRLLYTPNAFKYGADYFTFIVSADGIVFSAETRYNVTATFVNIAPQLACSNPLTPDFSLFADDSLRLQLLAGPLHLNESNIAWESSPWELMKNPTSPYNSWVKVVASLVPTASYNSDHAYGKKAMDRFLLHYTVGLMFYAGKQLNDGTLYFAVASDTTSDSRLQMEKPDPVFVNHYVCGSQSDLPVPMSYPDRWTSTDGGAMSYGTPAGDLADPKIDPDKVISVETGRPFLDSVPVFNGVRFVMHAYDPDENATMTYRFLSLPVHGSLFYVDPDQVVAYLEATNQNKDTLGVAMELPPMREDMFLKSTFLKNVTAAGQEIRLVQPLNTPDGQVGASIWDPINLIYLPNAYFAGAPVDFMQWQAIDSQGNVSEVSTVRFFASCPQGFTRTETLAPLTGLPVPLNAWNCVKCKKGTHASVSQNLGSGKSFDQEAGTCQSCLLGQAQPLFSQISCNTCGLDTYQDTVGSETCKKCPDTSMESNKGSTAVSQCICKTGFFPNKVSANASITCAQCDAATQICEKGQSYPLPARVGIYIDPNDGTRVEQCLVVEACPMWTDPLFVKNGSCARGYESSLCAKCALRYYRSNGICKKCASNAWIIYIGAGAALCIIIPIFFKLAQFDVFASINIIVAYLQALSVFRNFKFQWPPQLLRFLNLISVFNIQIDLVAPECSVRKWKYVNKIWISYLIPLGFIIIFVFYYVIVRTKDKRRARARARIRPIDHDHPDRHSIGSGKPSTPDKRHGSSQGPATARVAPMPHSDTESSTTKPPPSPPRPGSPSAYPDAYGGGGGGGGYGQQYAGGNAGYGYPVAYQEGPGGEAPGYSYPGISTAEPYGVSYGADYGQQGQLGYAPASAGPDASQPGARRGVQFADDAEDDPALAPSARSKMMGRKASMKKAPRDIEMYPDVVIQNTAELNLGANTRVERMGWSARGTHAENDDDDKAKPRGLVRMDIRLRKGLAGFLVFLSFTYFMLASATAEYFNCKKIGSATVSSPTGGASTTTRAGYYMTKDSSTQCWDFNSPNIHLLLLPAAIAAIFFYVIGIPLVYGILLHSVRPVLINRTEIKRNITYKDKQKDFSKKELRTKDQLEAAEQSIGFLFKRYKDMWYFWEILIVLRKLSFTIMLFLGQIEQILSITAVCIVYITALFFARPYNVAHLNYMEMVAMTMCVLIIYCGYFFYSDLLSPNEIDYLAIVIQVLLISSIVLLVGFVVYDISPKIQGVFRQLRMAKNYKRLRAQARAAMARGSARAFKTMSLVLRKEDEVEHNIHKRVRILWIKLRALAHFTIPPRKKFILHTFKKVLAAPTMDKFRPWLLQVATPEQVEEAYFTAEVFDKYFSPVKERLDKLEADHLIKVTHVEKIHMKEAEGNALMTRALRTMTSMHRNTSRLRVRPDDHERVDDWQLLKNILKEYINSRRDFLRRQLELLAKSRAASGAASRAASSAALDKSNKGRKGKSRKERVKSEAASENEASIIGLRGDLSRPKSLTATQLKKLEQDAAQQALAKNRLFKWVLGKLGAEDEVVQRAAESASVPVVQCVKPERYYRTQGIFQMGLAPAILEVAAFYADEPNEDGQVVFREEDRAAINQIVRAIAGAEDDVAASAYDGLYKQGTRFVLVDLSGFQQSHIDAMVAQQERDYRPNFYPTVNMETGESVALPTEELPFVSMNKSVVFEEEPEEQRGEGGRALPHAEPSGNNMFSTFTGSGRISNVEAHGAFEAAQRRASVEDKPAQPAVTNSRPPVAGPVPDTFYEGAEPPGSVGSPKEGLGRTTGPGNGNGAIGGGGTGTNTNGSSTPKGPSPPQPQAQAAAVAVGHASQPQGSLLGSATGSTLGAPVDPRAASAGRTGTVDLQDEDFF